MSSYSDISRELAKSIALQVLQALPAVAGEHSVDEAADAILNRAGAFVFKPNSSLGSVVAHIAMDWPDTDELDGQHKLRLALGANPVDRQDVVVVAEALMPRIGREHSKLHYEVAATVQGIVEAIESRTMKTEEGMTPKQVNCDVVAFDWGALNSAPTVIAIEAFCSAQYPYFAKAVQGGEVAMIDNIAALSTKAKMSDHRASVDAVKSWIANADLGLSADLADYITRPMRAEGLVTGAVAEMREGAIGTVNGINKLSKTLSEIELVSRAKDFGEKFPTLVDNIGALRSKIYAALGCGMVLQNAPVGSTLVMSYRPDQIVVNGMEFDRLDQAVISTESMVTTAEYMQENALLRPKNGVTTKQIAFYKEKADAWAKTRKATDRKALMIASREAFRGIVMDALNTWAASVTEDATLRHELHQKAESTSLRMAAGKTSVYDGVFKLVMDVTGTPATKRLADDMVMATESFGVEPGRAELHAVTAEILRTIITDRFASPVRTA